MAFLGNIAFCPGRTVLSQFARVLCYLGSKTFLHLVLVLTWLCSSSSDYGVKYLASSLTQLGTMCHLGSLGMSCNLSFASQVLVLLQTVFTVAFPACTLLLDIMWLKQLHGYGGSGTEATGGADTGLWWCSGCLATCCMTSICGTWPFLCKHHKWHDLIQ